MGGRGEGETKSRPARTRVPSLSLTSPPCQHRHEGGMMEGEEKKRERGIRTGRKEGEGGAGGGTAGEGEGERTGKEQGRERQPDRERRGGKGRWGGGGGGRGRGREQGKKRERDSRTGREEGRGTAGQGEKRERERDACSESEQQHIGDHGDEAGACDLDSSTDWETQGNSPLMVLPDVAFQQHWGRAYEGQLATNYPTGFGGSCGRD